MRWRILKFSWIILPLLLAALTTLSLVMDIKAGREAAREFAEEQGDLLHLAASGISEAFTDLDNAITSLAHPTVAVGEDELEAAMAVIYEHTQLHGAKILTHIVFYNEREDTTVIFPSGSTTPFSMNMEGDRMPPGFTPVEPAELCVSKPFEFNDCCVVALSTSVRNQAVQGLIVGYLNLSQIFQGHLSGIGKENTALYVLDETGGVVIGPDLSRGDRLGDYLDKEDPRSAFLRLFLRMGYRSLVRFRARSIAEAGGASSLSEGEGPPSAVGYAPQREMIGLLHPFELGGNRFFLLSLRDWDGLIAPARAAQRRYWFAFGGFFLLLVLGGVLYWRRQLTQLEREREDEIRRARALEVQGLKSIREINRALLSELEFGRLLDLVARNISEALGLAGLQVLAPDNKGNNTEGAGYRLVTTYFDDELRNRMAGLRKGAKRPEDTPADADLPRNPILPVETLKVLIADVAERVRRTGRSLRITPGDDSTSEHQQAWAKALRRAERLGVSEFVICPLGGREHPEGFAVFLSRQAGIPLELYETFASNLAQAIRGAQNIEDQRRTLHELDQAYGRMRAFSRIGAEIVVQKNFLRIGQRLVDAISTYSNFSRCVLSLVEGDEMRRIAFGNLTEKEIEDLHARKPFSLDDLARIRKNAKKISRSYYLPASLAKGTLGEVGITSTHAREEFINWDPNDFFFVPLEGLDGELLGVISVDDPKDGLAPTEATIQPLESFAHLAAQAITTSRLRWELERSQNDYRNLFRDAADALFVLDEGLKVIASNRQFSILAGEPEGETVGTFFIDLVVQDWRAAVGRAFERVKSGLGRQELEFRLQTRGSGERIVAMKIEAKAFPRLPSILDDGGGETGEVMDPKTDLAVAVDGGFINFQGSLRDITYSKEAERELLRRQEQLKIINTLGRLALSSFDLEPLFDQTVEAINRSLNYDNVAIFMVDEGTNELVMEAQSGIFDVLVRKGYRVYMSEGVVGWTARSGVTRYVPDAGKDPHFIMPAGVFEIGAELAIPLLVEGDVKGVLDLETTEANAFDPADISALETIADQLSQAIHNIRLYQELRERALALALANEELLKVDKMKSDFVSMVSHELNTPVTVIKGYAQLMVGGIIGEINEKQQDILETIVEKSDHLSHLIFELLDLLKIETDQYLPEFQTVNLTKVLEELFAEQSKYIDTPRMSLALELPEQPIVLDMDLPKIRAVFTHLLSNATKFTIGEGTVTISGEELENGYRFTVEDTGIGIPEVEFERIFERLYQVDSTLTRHYGGTGLGLAITRAIVERHQGRIWVESELGEGSRFIITLPKTNKQEQT